MSYFATKQNNSSNRQVQPLHSIKTYRVGELLTSGSGCPPGASIIPWPSATPLLLRKDTTCPSEVSTTAPTPSFWDR